LSLKATRTPDDEVEPVLKELQAAILDKIELVRALAAEQFLGADRSSQERRSTARGKD
jgi:hypothetical protein